MKKLACAALAALLILVCSIALASNKVSSIDVDVALLEDGSAEITQTWICDFEEGTECFIPIARSGYLTIDDFSVTNETGPFEFTEPWDVKASFDEKAKKCGIVEDEDGYELCWGISSYGEARTYTIKYTVHSILGSYTDGDGFYFRFINDNMNTTPTDVSLTLRAASGVAFDELNTSVSARGFEGTTSYERGAIVMTSTEPIDSDGHVTVLFTAPKGLFSPERETNEELDSLRRAYKADEKLDTAAILLTLFGVAAVLIVPACVYAYKRKKAINAFAAAHGMTATAPLGGFMPAVAVLGSDFDRFPKENLLLSVLASLISCGSIAPSDEGDDSMRLVHPPVPRIGESGEALFDYERELYERLETASRDGILSEKALEKSLERHPALLTDFLENCFEAGRRYIDVRDCFIVPKKHTELKHLTPEGEAMLAEVTGLGLYFDSFSHMDDKSVDELRAFADLMPYALLYGVSEKAVKELSSRLGGMEGASASPLFSMRYAFVYYTCFTNSGASSGMPHSGGFSGGGSGGGTR